MSEDIPLILSEILHIPDLHVDGDNLQGGLMYELQTIFTFYGKTLRDFGLDLPPPHLLQVLNNIAIMEERNYDHELLRSESDRLTSQLNTEQRMIFEQVTHDVNNHQ